MQTTTNIQIKTASSIHSIEPAAWDELSAGKPFQSHRWYVYGERVMSDCEPVYLLAYQDEQLIARAALWVIRNEPLPQYVGSWRGILQAALRRWPLLVCRSPLAYTTGLILPVDVSLREQVFTALTQASLTQGRQRKCSALLFDYLASEEKNGWAREFIVTEISNPGTVMQSHWPNFEAYLQDGTKKDRQHYKRTVREAEKLNIQIARHSHANNLQEALPLVRTVEREHGAPENPWTRAALENIEMVDGTFLSATINGELVGCGVVFEDNNSQMAALLGLARDTPYVYFMLIYENLKVAFEKNIQWLRGGSGAYEVKQKLGFSLEDNGIFAYVAIHPLLQVITRWFN
jgi:predicted N-acyltransferase